MRRLALATLVIGCAVLCPSGLGGAERAPRPAIPDPSPRDLLSIIDERDRRYDQRFIDSKEAVNTALSAAKEAVNAALIAAKEAVLKAENASEKRFESVNEFRKTLSDQQTQFATKADLKYLAEKIATLEAIVNQNTNRSDGIASAWGYVGAALGIVGVLIGIGGVVFKLLGTRPAGSRN